MTGKNESPDVEMMRADRKLFQFLLNHVVQAATNEDSSDFILASIGRNVGADRSSVYWFWDPGKSSMCSNTHEWCADGVKQEIGAQQACNLADLVDFNDCITSGRDFMFTDIDEIDVGSRSVMEQLGIKSLIASPLAGAGGTICGFVAFSFVKAPCDNFTERIVENIHAAAILLVNCQMLHQRDLALQDIMHGRNEYEENDREFERALLELRKDASKVQPKHMLEIVQNRMDADLCYLVQMHPDGGGFVAAGNLRVRDGWTNSRTWTIDTELWHVFDTRLKASSVVTFHDNEFQWIRDNSVMEDSMPDSLARLKLLYCFGVRNEGRLVGVLCIGYNDERSLSAPLIDFLRRAALVAVTTLERIDTYHDLVVSLNIAHFRSEVVEFMFKHHSFEEIRAFIGGKVCSITGVQHLMLCTDDGLRYDWFGDDAPDCCRKCVNASAVFGKTLPPDFFAESETVIMQEGSPLPNMNLPRYCPMKSSVISQFKMGGGRWRMVADYTKPHRNNLSEVARDLRVALELLAIAYDRERHEKTIAQLQEHQRYRADMLAYALSKDDLPGLVDMMMRRLIDLTECDYIALHSVDGDHWMMDSSGKLEDCPDRCRECAFYKFVVPPLEDEDHIIELADAQCQPSGCLPHNCPAKSIEIVVVYCEGKPWGAIALHYLKRQQKILDKDRFTLKIAADVLTLAIERHSAAVRLKAERDRVVEAEKSRSYFFSSVSHDIRTPLNAIIGFSELLQSGDVPPDEARENLRMIMTSGRMLLQLVNDVLDFSRMDLGKLEFNMEPTDVGEVVRELVLMFKAKLADKGQTIVTEVPDLPHLMLDPHRFRQIMFNFIGNAVKYAGPCTIRISIAYEDGTLKMTVADNGKGVTAEKAKRLMQPFVQADIKNRSDGFGLGLAICRRLIELLHGNISVDTAPGRGFAVHTEVKVSVAPEVKPDDGSPASAAAPAKSGMPGRILVADDSPVNRAVLSAMLRRLKIADIVLVEDGQAALDKLLSEPPFDVVLTDMWMPVMDGAELVKRIRADKRFEGLKVCAFTADVEVLPNYRQQGFDAIILKPATIEKLEELFRQL